MNLTELDPEFVRWEDKVEKCEKVAPGFEITTEDGYEKWVAAGRPFVEEMCIRTYLPSVPTLAEAQGILINCPKCQNSQAHRISIAFAGRGVLDHQATVSSDGRPTRWTVTGTGMDDLTLTPSIDCTSRNPNCWHGFITAGDIT